MLRVFNFVELEEFDLLVTEAWPLIPQSSEMGRSSFTRCNEYKQTQANIYLHKNITPYKIKYYQNKHYKTRERFYDHAGKRTTIDEAMVKGLARLRQTSTN